MAEKQEGCPGCGRADGTTTLPDAHREGSGLPGGPGAAPAPPLPAPPPEPAPRWAYAVLAGIGALVLLRLLVGVAVDGPPRGGTAYGNGELIGSALLPLALLGTFGVRYAVVTGRNKERLAAHRRETGRVEQQRAVWEAALLCRHCPAVYVPAGALRPDFPASGAIPPEQFPVIVVTLAEQAYGGSPPTTAETAGRAPA